MTNAVQPTRRAIVGGIGAGSIAALGGAASPAQAQSERKTYVLVHGAWHGGWCWRRVADLLEKQGHKVFAPTLTGLGERSHLINPNVNLATHVTDVVNVIKWEGLKDIVLVGHSYAGSVITGVAEQAQTSINAIVFLDAFFPANGDSVAGAASQPVRDAIAAALQKGETTMKPVPAAVFRVNEKDRAWVDAMCTPQPIATLTDKATVTGPREKIANKTYIRAAGYPSVPFDAALNQLKANSAWRTHELPCGHDAMVDMPERLAELLVEAGA